MDSKAVVFIEVPFPIELCLMKVGGGSLYPPRELDSDEEWHRRERSLSLRC